jgi:pimeloyl-ACP methyl ester carboxylesterase
MHTVKHRNVESNGITLHVAEQGEGPLVILCHGFPECWYSWRHQMAALASAGYRAVACDQRGYGRSSAPERIEEYTLCHLAGDIVGLVYALGETSATIVGHDWGSPVAWTCALLRPDLFPSVCLMSVPFLPFPIGQPRLTTQLRAAFGDKHFYQLYFQEAGVAESELEEDVRASMLKLLYAGSGDAPPEESFRFVFDRGQRFIDAHVLPHRLPPWLTEADLEYFTGEFARTGFRGGLNWYRNLDRDYELLAPLANAKIEQPTLFLAGEKDVCITMYRDAYDGLEQTVPGLIGKQLLAGAGHWVQQERPRDVNDLLLAFLRAVRAPAPGAAAAGPSGRS